MKPFFLALWAFCGLWAMAQTETPLQFTAPVHDFGTLKEEQQSAEHVFTFVNTAKVPLTLTDVKPSCGCTAPKWSTDPVAPGATGNVTAVYTTTGRPGKFEKFITVKAKVAGSEAEQVVVLTIRGDVTPRAKTVADYFPQQDGALRLNTNHIANGVVYAGTQSEKTLKLYNESSQPITLKSFNAPKHITVLAQPGVQVRPGDSLSLPVVYDSRQVNDWGFIHHVVTFDTDDPSEDGRKGQKRIYVSADIQENFSALSDEERAAAPKAIFDKKAHDYGKVTAGDKVTTQFTITNGGQRPLIIRKTKASCGCTATQPAKTVLAPGEATTVSVTFDTTAKEGKQQKSVTVVTNDPGEPTVYLMVSAEVQVAGTTGK